MLLFLTQTIPTIEIIIYTNALNRNINAFDTHPVFNAERESNTINIAHAGFYNIYLTTSQGNNIINYYMTRDRTSTHINK